MQEAVNHTIYQKRCYPFVLLLDLYVCKAIAIKSKPIGRIDSTQLFLRGLCVAISAEQAAAIKEYCCHTACTKQRVPIGMSCKSRVCVTYSALQKNSTFCQFTLFNGYFQLRFLSSKSPATPITTWLQTM